MHAERPWRGARNRREAELGRVGAVVWPAVVPSTLSLGFIVNGQIIVINWRGLGFLQQYRE